MDETISRLLSWKGEMNKLLDSLSEMVYLTRKVGVCGHAWEGDHVGGGWRYGSLQNVALKGGVGSG